MAAALAAYGGEPGGFRPGLYAGEIAAGLFTSTPSVVAGLSVVIPATGSG
jgi:hypothetical protein